MWVDLFYAAAGAAAITAIVFERKITNQSSSERERLACAHKEARHAQRLAKDYKRIAALWLDGEVGDSEFIEELSRLVAENELPTQQG